MLDYLPFLLLLVVLAAVMREDSVLTIFYLVAGAYFLGRWWSTRSLKNIFYERVFTNRAFLGETVPIRLTLRNTSWLPTLWLNLHESLPLDLVTPNFFRQIIHLGPRETQHYHYNLHAQKRGYYRVGPLFLRSGDLIGLSEDQELVGDPNHLIVYPKIVPLTKLGLPSHSPFGSLRHTLPVFEDPSRVIGKREYSPGDSLRHIDWKSSATNRQLLIKKFEPSIALEVFTILDLYAPGYELKVRFDQTELGIVAAASVANWVISKRQSAGFWTNGVDPLNEATVPQAIPVRKGQAHLMRCLELMARIQAGDTDPVHQMLPAECARLAWGTTIVLITGHLDDSLFDALFQVHRSGMNISVLLLGPQPGIEQLRRRAREFNISMISVPYETDLRGKLG